jgi:hypothetical protein
MFDVFRILRVQGETVAWFLQQLRNEGFDATEDIYKGIPGIIIGPKGLDETRMPIEEMPFPLPAGRALALFFPVWELNDPINRRFVVERNFHDLCDARPQSWRLPLRAANEQIGY